MKEAQDARRWKHERVGKADLGDHRLKAQKVECCVQRTPRVQLGPNGGFRKENHAIRLKREGIVKAFKRWQ